MKKASLKRAADKQLADKEKFIYDQGDNAKPLKDNSRLEGEKQTIKKASCYLPRDLWLKYKAYELDQVRIGKSVGLNSLIVELLSEKLKNYK